MGSQETGSMYVYSTDNDSFKVAESHETDQPQYDPSKAMEPQETDQPHPRQ